MIVGGIVLCGGASRRMGAPKAMLPFGEEVMLERVVRLLSTVVKPVAVVAAVGQSLPALPKDVIIVRDRVPDRGPLQGLLDGLHGLDGQVDAVYATGCDVPLLQPAFVRLLIDELGSRDIAVPVEGSHFHPLAALYRATVAPVIGRLLEQDARRLIALYDQVATLEVPVKQLHAADPQLLTLLNVNRPEQYRQALEQAGLELP